jgi:hypothetical protein
LLQFLLVHKGRMISFISTSAKLLIKSFITFYSVNLIIADSQNIILPVAKLFIIQIIRRSHSKEVLFAFSRALWSATRLRLGTSTVQYLY